MKSLQITVYFFLGLFYSLNTAAQTSPSILDVLVYKTHLEPDFTAKQIKGHVVIQFLKPTKSNTVTFNSGNLTVTKVEGDHVKGFTQKNKKTTVSFYPNNANNHKITLHYHGKPKRGLIFDNQLEELYTVYFTSEWMICHDSPDDKAIFNIDLIVPNHLTCMASGILTDSITMGDKIKYSWRQPYETPPYTYGLAIGSFNQVEENYGGTMLKYYANNHSPEQLKQIFQYTGDMIYFFEEKAGTSLPQDIYSQVLIGDHYQEMSGFAVLNKIYGELVLNDSTETNLISHELAHQWWGNRITCKSWNHFWLNEGMATFMSAVYNEHRFGKEKYQKDIDSYFNVYHKIKAKGGDKPLVFKSWANPSGDDRNLVYFKGAYVLHLLRQEMGEKDFWKGIKHYSQTYCGQSVTTKDFQLAMEKYSQKPLRNFFDKWVY